VLVTLKETTLQGLPQEPELLERSNSKVSHAPIAVGADSDTDTATGLRGANREMFLLDTNFHVEQKAGALEPQLARSMLGNNSTRPPTRRLELADGCTTRRVPLLDLQGK